MSRDLFEAIDRRVGLALGGQQPVAVMRGTVVTVAPGSFRLAAILDGQGDVTPNIAFGANLNPYPGDDTLILRRPDGFQLAIAILGREGYQRPYPTGLWARRGDDTPTLQLDRSQGGETVVADMELGAVRFSGHDGNDYQVGASIAATVDGTPGAGDLPGRLRFSTTADGASIPTERLAVRSSGVVELLSGQLRFPASQNASSDPNTLDDYEEGTWTPTLTYATPGDLSVAYSDRVGRYVKIGRLVFITMRLTCTPWFTTASGTLYIDGVPFTFEEASYFFRGQHAFVQPISWPGGVVGPDNLEPLPSTTASNRFLYKAFGATGQVNLSTGHITSGVFIEAQASFVYREA